MQGDFSKLSGDYNPIHLDQEYAYNSIFGQNIAFGVLVLLFPISLASDLSQFRHADISGLDITFSKPALLNVPVVMHVKDSTDTTLKTDKMEKFSISLFQKDLLIMKGFLTIKERDSGELTRTLFADECYPVLTPDEQISDFNKIQGNFVPRFSAELATNLFGNKLLSMFGEKQIIDILSLSKIVGMHSPGKNSIFSAIYLASAKHESAFNSIRYKCSDHDERFHLIKTEFFGTELEGYTKAFVRPHRTALLSMKEATETVRKKEFSEQRALVIGGSKGLGAATVNLLLAGGAEVMASYRYSKKNIKEFQIEQLTASDNSLIDIYFDVTDKNNSFEEILDFKPTHIYYFATPKIFQQNKEVFSSQRLNLFNDLYVYKFLNFVSIFCKSTTLKFFHPSSIAVSEKNFPELEYKLCTKVTTI